MVECGHAANAVPVLVEHAKQVGHAAMLEVLGPLAGKADSEARPVLEGLLATVSGGVTVTLRSSGASLVQPVGAVPDLVERPPAPPPTTPSAPSPEPVEPMTPPMIELAGPFAIPESAVPPPPPQPPLPFAPPPPITPEPLVPTSAALPSPSSLGLDLSPPLPPSTLESAAIDMRRRALRTSQETFLKSVPPPERAEPPPVRKRASGARRSVLPPPRRSRALLWVGFAVIVVGIAGGLVYFGVVPIGPVETVRAPAPRVPTRPKRAPPPPKRAAPARARADSIVPPSPGSIPTPSRPAATRANRPPPVYIQGLTVDSYSGTTRNGAFRLLQRQSSGERITLIGSPLANVVGEPAVGEVRLGSLGDTAIVTTNFAGYLIRLRGVVAPATLQALVGKLVSTPSNE